MEQALTKDQILDLYLNQIYFGHSRYGVEEAALFYFGKHAAALTVGEAAVLAGHGAAARAHQPGDQHREARKKRQRYVLGQMVKPRLRSRRPGATRSWKARSCSGPARRRRSAPYYVEEIRRHAGRPLRR